MQAGGAHLSSQYLRGRGCGYFSVQDHSGPQREFQDNQGYTKKLCLKKQKPTNVRQTNKKTTATKKDCASIHCMFVFSDDLTVVVILSEISNCHCLN